jgi:hypothetical protein
MQRHLLAIKAAKPTTPITAARGNGPWKIVFVSAMVLSFRS